MNLRLTKLKIIISIITIVAWYIIMAMAGSSAICEMYCGENFNYNDCSILIPLFQDYGCCSCPTTIPFQDMLTAILILLIPGALTYVIWSLFQKKKK